MLDKTIADLNAILDFWILQLQRYSYTQLCIQPAPKHFSMGQLYTHLLEDTRFYLEEIRECTSHNNFADEQPSPMAKIMLANNDFPDQKLQGDPSNEFIPQPRAKDQLLKDFQLLKSEIENASELVLKSSFRGRSKHPGFQYLNAQQWLQLAEMHFRHHLRQKKRIDVFLENYSPTNNAAE